MMRIRTLGSSLGFGALAALSLILMDPLLSAPSGGESSFWPYVGGCLVVYAGLLGGRARERVRNVLVAGGIVALVLAGARDGATIAVGLTFGLAIVRTGLDARLRTPRAWLRESPVIPVTPTGRGSPRMHRTTPACGENLVKLTFCARPRRPARGCTMTTSGDRP